MSLVPVGDARDRFSELIGEVERTHASRDVVVPQFLGRLEFVLALQQLCDDVGAEFIEVVLLSNPQDAARRFARRCAQPETAEHRDARALLERSGGPDELPEMYDRLLQVVARRPGTRTVVTVDGQLERAYADFLTQISTGGTPGNRRVHSCL